MSSADEQAILKCSMVERELDIMYCRSLQNFEPRGEVVMSCSTIDLKRSTSKKEGFTSRQKDCIALLVILFLILDKVDFVDKIIFGRWNYNPEIKKYEEAEQFYITSSDQVIDFCKERGIPYHIKKHTPRSDEKTESLFLN